MRVLRQSLPALVSLALLAWVLSRVSFGELFAATLSPRWPLIVAATLLLVAALYAWEAVCFRELFRGQGPGRTLTYRQMLRIRGVSYLAGVVNYEAGQALAAWHIARSQSTPLLTAVSRMILLAYHDLVVIFALAAVGATLSSSPQAVTLRPFCWAGFVGLICLAGGWKLWMPTRWQQRFRASRFGAWIEDWSWQRSIRLAGLRTVYFLIFVIYAATAVRLGGINLDLETMLGTIPLVLLADALPLPSASGLGTRDAAMQLLISTDQKGVLTAISLTWSLGLLLGRAAIGVAWLWRPRRRAQTDANRPAEARYRPPKSKVK